MSRSVTRLVITSALAGPVVVGRACVTGAQRAARPRPGPLPDAEVCRRRHRRRPPSSATRRRFRPAHARRATPTTRSTPRWTPPPARITGPRGDHLAEHHARTPTSELRLHLYWNAWKNTRSTFLQESRLGGHPRQGRLDRPLEDFSHIIESRPCACSAPAPRRPSTSRRRCTSSSPTTATPTTRRVMRVPLPLAVRPGDTINVEIEWTAKVPRTFARTGAIGRYFFLAQWFPKVGVLEADGWNAHQFHAGTEFFADFGVYDVRLQVPAGLGGRRHGRRAGAAPTTPTAPRPIATSRTTSTTSRGRPAPTSSSARRASSTSRCRPPRCGCCCSPSTRARPTATSTRRATALRYYGEWFGPIPTATSRSSTPRGRAAAAAWSTRRCSPAARGGWRRAGVASPEGVTVHEAGHQFWYGIVATNEFEHAWMDEGFNTYSTGARARAS